MAKLFNLSVEEYRIILVVVVIFIVLILRHWYKKHLWLRQYRERRDYYRNVYLKSDAWQRKRYVVLKRDNWRCVYCGSRATQVHHTKYAKYNIGKEPIEWLESVFKSCHDSFHN